MADVQFNILDRSDSYLEKIFILLNRKCLKEIKKIFELDKETVVAKSFAP